MIETKITYSSKPLSAKERIRIKDTINDVRLDDLTAEQGSVTIPIDYYAVLAIHNDASESVDYTRVVVVALDGTHYVTGSPSFLQALKDIVDEMENEPEDYSIIVSRHESKNYKGKSFLTCTIG